MSWWHPMVHDGDQKLFSNTSFILRNETERLVSFNSQLMAFRISIKEVEFLFPINAQNLNKVML